MDGSPVARSSGAWSDGDRLQTSIRRHQVKVRPNGISAHTRLDKWSASRAIYKSQGLSVPVRSVSPFSDPSSNLAPSSRSGAIWLTTGKHGPDYPCILVGDRDCRAVVTAPLAKLVDPHTSQVGFSNCGADNRLAPPRKATAAGGSRNPAGLACCINESLGPYRRCYGILGCVSAGFLCGTSFPIRIPRGRAPVY
jgi:hypothetical protein